MLGESARCFPVLTFEDIGLGRGTRDLKALENARHGAIVITRNSSDFSKAAQKAARDSMEGACKAIRCKDGIGLVTVRHHLTSFPFGEIKVKHRYVQSLSSRRLGARRRCSKFGNSFGC